MREFRHNEFCMGTVFTYFGRTDRPPAEVEAAVRASALLLHEADEIFSLYKPESPLSRLARGEASMDKLPPIVEEIWDQCEIWSERTDGWFKPFNQNNMFDPSGLVKTWAAERACQKLEEFGITDFAMNAGGDIRLSKSITSGLPKRVGIAKPVSIAEKSGVLTVIDLNDSEYFAVATSGTAERGEHIWNPKTGNISNELVQVSVVAKDIITADIFATAAFAAGDQGFDLLKKHEGELEALLVYPNGELQATAGFATLLKPV
jgi:thiamine biosynthesis lipoprotein